MRRFPDGFLWGVATSAFQIEGALDVDGRGSSIWDDFAGERGETGASACDHYRRWPEDVELLGELGVNAYRFSIAWPRLFPDGDSRRERRGFDHYDRLLDALLARGIEPVVTLYHWDLPRTLDWRERDTVDRYAEYAVACFEAYGDRVGWWVTINEPWVHGLLGYQDGAHAPGLRDLPATVRVFHHLLLAHGLAAQAAAPARAGIALALHPHYPLRPADADAARASDGYVNRWFLDPLYGRGYPDDTLALWEELVGPLDFVHDGDLETVATPTRFVGVNFYGRRVVRAADPDPFPWQPVPAPPGHSVTDAGGGIVPHTFVDLLLRVRDDYGDVPILITENGADLRTSPDDARRVAFVHDHLAALHAAIDLGVSVVGYCHWSFLDNFEWASGYEPRFGLVHVDYETQQRTIKDSGRYYARVARANALVPA